MLKNVSIIRGITSLGLGLLLTTGCVSRADVEEIKKNQADILAKLDAVKAAPAGPKPQARRPQGPDPAKTYGIAVGDAAVKGPDDAWVTIVEISDFQCPYCSRVNPTITELGKKYGDDIRIAFKHNALPFHQRAKPAARAAECAGEQGKFWEMHDVLFANQKQLEDTNLEGYAGQVGLNVGKWKQCYTSNKFDSRIDGHQREATQFGARGTPAFFINGRFLSGAQPIANFERIIDEELKKAKGSGVAKASYYSETVVKKGAKSL